MSVAQAARLLGLQPSHVQLPLGRGALRRSEQGEDRAVVTLTSVLKLKAVECTRGLAAMADLADLQNELGLLD